MPKMATKAAGNVFYQARKEASKWNDRLVRVLYSCTDEHNKALNKAALETFLYEDGAFWVQEITPAKISITVNKEAMSDDNSPEEHLRRYFGDKEYSPERIAELIDTAAPFISEAAEAKGSGAHTGVFIPLKIEVKNYRNYRDESFDYDGIRFCTINGENGAGKSSLFMDAMLDALFEEPREGDLTGWICNDPDVRSGSIQFTFSIGEATYRVTRTRTKSGKATLNSRTQLCGSLRRSCEYRGGVGFPPEQFAEFIRKKPRLYRRNLHGGGRQRSIRQFRKRLRGIWACTMDLLEQKTKVARICQEQRKVNRRYGYAA